MIQRKKLSSDDDDAPATFRYTQKPVSERYASNMCDNHCSSDDEIHDEIVEKDVTNNRTWFPREEYSEDEDLVSEYIGS